ncbi:MAG TPA: type II toxin-antitoxin system VapC family toxin [Chloroflexota bacterium]|nr:type II toxin-antitoxin system VapC family toxin [Chloroflexota bacterium]
MAALCQRSAGHALLIAPIATMEVASALNRKLRENRLDAERRDRLWRLFRLHLRGEYRIIALDDQIYRLAVRILFHHALRAYDALHLATALRATRLLAGLTADFRFCTADLAQAEAAGREGLIVDHIS